MKTFIYGLMLATGLGLAGCAKSYHAEVEDVREQERQAQENVREKQRELEDTVVDENRKIREEQREAEDAARREAERNENRTDTLPDVTP
jgi:hypothetical protein